MKVTSDPAVGKVFLGRPWRSYATVIFLSSELDAKGDPAGWSEWHPEETHRLETAFYAEYQSQGPGAGPGKREHYSKQLTEDEKKKYSLPGFLAGSDHWDPLQVK